MDALDAGAYAYVYQAQVPKHLKVVLWGPLQAKEMGFSDWTYQDGGETGFVYHKSGRALRMGLATATLIVVRRLGEATLAVYMGGYPSDAAPEQRRLDARTLANEAELFLSRLAGETVRFSEAREVVLVERTITPTTTTAPAARGRKGPLFEA